MKLERLKEITELREPTYKDGGRRPEDSDKKLLSDGDLEKYLLEEKNKQLVWNDYFEDIGEGKTYRGQWMKQKDFLEPKEKQDRTNIQYRDSMKKSGGAQKGGAPPAERVRWTGIGTIKFEDGSKYEGQT